MVAAPGGRKRTSLPPSSSVLCVARQSPRLASRCRGCACVRVAVRRTAAPATQSNAGLRAEGGPRRGRRSHAARGPGVARRTYLWKCKRNGEGRPPPGLAQRRPGAARLGAGGTWAQINKIWNALRRLVCPPRVHWSSACASAQEWGPGLQVWGLRARVARPARSKGFVRECQRLGAPAPRWPLYFPLAPCPPPSGWTALRFAASPPQRRHS